MIYVTHDQVEAMTMGTRICIMNGGRVAQVGPPLEVYRHPANTFVASFLGNPPMTLLPAVATDKSSGRCLKVGDSEIELPPNRCPPLQPGSQVTFGIRPEHVAQRPVANGAATPIEAEIVRVEPLGAETIVIARLPGVEKLAFARLAGDAIFPIGERRQLFLDTGHGPRIWQRWLGTAACLNDLRCYTSAKTCFAPSSATGLVSRPGSRNNSDTVFPDPPNSEGKSLNFVRPSFIGSTVSP